MDPTHEGRSTLSASLDRRHSGGVIATKEWVMETIERMELEDEYGERHPIAPGTCRCGCTYLYALDDSGISWLVGDWEFDGQMPERCIDRRCSCHRRIRVPELQRRT